MTEPEYKLCKRGHVRSPENTSKDNRCKLCRIENRHKYYMANKQATFDRSKKWIGNNKERHKELMRNAAAKARAKNPDRIADGKRKYATELKPHYITNVLRIRVSEATPELIALKRQQILFKRELKQLKKAIGDN